MFAYDVKIKPVLPFIEGVCLKLTLQGFFILAAGFIHPWVVGGYWALPLQYIQNGLAINEFTGGPTSLHCDVLCCAVLCCAVLCCAVLRCAAL